jgi:TonB family protein
MKFAWLLCLLVSTAATAQTTSTYFSDKYLSKRVSENKAKFVEHTTENEDGSITIEVVYLKTNRVVSKTTHKDDMPVGVWQYDDGETTSVRNYDFEIVYSELDKDCAEAMKAAGLGDPTKDNPSINYVSAKPANGEETIFPFLLGKMEYPVAAKEQGIQGVVYLNYTVTQAGKVENVFVIRGVHPILDKEASRIVQLLEYDSGATLNGQPFQVCFTIPIRYQLN